MGHAYLDARLAGLLMVGFLVWPACTGWVRYWAGQCINSRFLLSLASRMGYHSGQSVNSGFLASLATLHRMD